MKKWLITAEINRDASHYKDVTVEANSERKALILGEKKIRNTFDCFAVNNISAKEIKG